MATNSSKNNSTSHKESAMGRLLASHKDSFVTLKKGESLKGHLTKLSSLEVLVDIGAKSEAYVLEKDKHILHSILSSFKVGDAVEVNVLNPESDQGQPIVSMRRFLGNIAWERLEQLKESKEQIQVAIIDSAKAGYIVQTDFGISGFLPQSHTSLTQTSDLSLGARLAVTVLELNRKDNKIIFSQKTTISDDDFKQVQKVLPLGEKVEAAIVTITPVGLYVTAKLAKSVGKITEIEGFIHVSEISWDKVDDLSQLYGVGQKIAAVISKFDKETQRINLSVKRLTRDPFEKLAENYPVDKKVKAEVTKVDDTGVTVRLDTETEGLIRKEKIPPSTTYTVGQALTVLVSEYDKKRRKIILVPVLLEKPLGYR